MRRLLQPGSVCGASLDRLLGNLSDLEAELGAIDLIPYSRLRTKPGGAGTVLEQGPVPRGPPPGRPGPLVADRIDFPSSLSDFDAQPFLSHRSYLCLVSPDLFLKDEAEVSVELPVGKLADPQELFKLAQRWDKVHRVVLFKSDEVNPLDIADCFPVPKDGLPFPLPGTDRQILDRRRRNGREERVVTGSKTMPHSVQVSEIFLEPDEELRVSLDDLRNFYHMIGGSRERARTTPVGPAFEARLFRAWNAWETRFCDTDKLHVSWPGLGLGDLNAVDLAEEMHVGVLKDSGGMQAQHTMIYPKPLPYNLEGFFEGVMIDDHVGLQVVKSSAKPRPVAQDLANMGLPDDEGLVDSCDKGLTRTYMDQVFDAADANYTRVGLEAHTKKRKRNETHV